MRERERESEEREKTRKRRNKEIGKIVDSENCGVNNDGKFLSNNF